MCAQCCRLFVVCLQMAAAAARTTIKMKRCSMQQHSHTHPPKEFVIIFSACVVGWLVDVVVAFVGIITTARYSHEDGAGRLQVKATILSAHCSVVRCCCVFCRSRPATVTAATTITSIGLDSGDRQPASQYFKLIHSKQFSHNFCRNCSPAARQSVVSY